MERQKEFTGSDKGDSRLSALQTNTSAVRAIASAVEGTLGPKGLDTMLVDNRGEVIVTNDGVTILDRMEVKHPAARMLVNVAKAQQEEMGDGTTTATLLAAALVEEGAKQVFRGVPVAKVIAGIGKGVRFALQKMQEIARPIWELDDEWLQRIAFTAGRENEDISELVIEAAQMVGREKLMEKNFKLCDCVVAHPRAESEVFAGILINKGRMNLQMPAYKHDVRVLAVGDALEPEPVDEEALATEAGFARQMELKDEFLQVIEKLIQMDIGLIVVDRGVDPVAEEMLADAGVMVVQRVHTGISSRWRSTPAPGSSSVPLCGKRRRSWRRRSGTAKKWRTTSPISGSG